MRNKSILLLIISALTMLFTVNTAFAQDDGGEGDRDGQGGAEFAEPSYYTPYCYQPIRLSAGYNARVMSWPDIPNRLRNAAGFWGDVIGHIPAGGTFAVIAGPNCVDGINWWYVRYGTTYGYTAEGNGWNEYWLEPTADMPPTDPPCALTPRLVIGQNGRVTPGLPNLIRTAPGTKQTGAIYSEVIGEIPGNGVFAVMNGPQCGSDGRWWWLVNYNGVIGWTPEGEGRNTYWTEPIGTGAVACPGFMASRLIPGGLGRVTLVPYLPNTIRNTPEYGGLKVGSIPAGETFSVMSGPYCNQSTAWWMVSYGGVIGWTAEGQGSVYWLEPR